MRRRSKNIFLNILETNVQKNSYLFTDPCRQIRTVKLGRF